MLAQWLAPATAKPNGGDPQPPVPTPPKAAPTPRPTASKPYAARAAEYRLLAAMRDSLGLSANALAKAASASRSATSERLRRLAARGSIENDAAGRWRIAGADARPPPPQKPELRPPQPPAG
jgi:hypothetical protein